MPCCRSLPPRSPATADRPLPPPVKVLSIALKKLFDDGVKDPNDLYQEIERLILNPKSITAGELYGAFDKITQEWTDGVVPTLVRHVVDKLNEGNPARRWVICDGPVDAIWIENMNTVLDDNKTLCLANSERIKLPPTLTMMFEVEDLKVASPATVSRCGMVYMEQVHVGALSIVKTWVATTLRPALPAHADAITGYIEHTFAPAVAFMREFCT